MPVKLTEEEKKVLDEKKSEYKKNNTDQKKPEDKKNKSVDFVRKDTRPGVYSTDCIGKRIMIKNREHFIAKTVAEIGFCNKDPELIVFDSGTPNKRNK